MGRHVSQAIDRWFVRFESTPQDLAAFRIIYSVVALLYFWHRPLWTAELPSDFYDPRIGIGLLFPSPPSVTTLYAANWSLLAVLGLLLIGWKTPPIPIADHTAKYTSEYRFGYTTADGVFHGERYSESEFRAAQPWR